MQFSLLPLIAPILLAATSPVTADDIIERDVCVIGGGASGTYAAIRLRDLNQSVVLVEKQGALGGHTEAYTVPGTGEIIDYGVENFQNTSVVRDFFARFNVNLVPYASEATRTQYADFSTGKVYSNLSMATPDYTAYLEQVDRYPYLTYSFDLPSPIPEDLLLPFGEFITKYSLQDETYTMAAWSAGNGNVLNQTTLYILKTLDRAYIEGIESTDVMAEHDNHAIYAKAESELGSDALISSTVVSATRNNTNVQLQVSTPSGTQTIVAKKVLVAMPQNLNNMSPLDLDSTEQSIFEQFTNNALYVGLVNNTGVEDFVDTLGVHTSNTYNLPTLPGLIYLQSTTAAGVFRIWYSSAEILSQEKVESESLAAIKRLTGKTGDFVVFGNHNPYQLAVTPEAIRNGFYNDLNGLQGHRNTWYTGAAFLSHHTAALWNFTETLLPRLIAA